MFGTSMVAPAEPGGGCQVPSPRRYVVASAVPLPSFPVGTAEVFPSSAKSATSPSVMKALVALVISAITSSTF